jgi:hypothetical protein
MAKWFELSTEEEIQAEFNRLEMSELATKYNQSDSVKGIQRLSSIISLYEAELDVQKALE